MTTYTYAQLEGLWNQAGGDPSKAAIMAAIAMAESSGNSQATNHNSNGTTDEGLWQINTVWPQYQTFDPLGNAKGAVAIEQQQGLDAWSTYNSGAYKQFLNGSTTPDTNTGASGGGSNSSGSSNITSSASGLSQGCAFGIPSMSFGGSSGFLSFLGQATGIKTPEICFIRDSWLRAIFGGILIGVGGVVGVVGLAVLVKAITGHETGLKSAKGTVTDLFHHPAAETQSSASTVSQAAGGPAVGRTGAPKLGVSNPGPNDLTFEEALSLPPMTSGTYRSSTPGKKAQQPLGSKVKNPLDTPYSVGGKKPARKAVGKGGHGHKSLGGKGGLTAITGDSLSFDEALETAAKLMVHV